MLKPPEVSLEAKIEVLTEALLFLVRHSHMPNMADALIADLHRSAAQDASRKKVIDDLAYRLRERDELVAENDA